MVFTALNENGNHLSAYEDNIPESFEITYTTQTDWASGEIFSFFIGGVGSGLYVLSSYTKLLPGLVLGYFLVAAGKNLGHLFCASHRMKTFRAFSRPGSSWISRGSYALLAFTVLGGVDLLLRLEWLPETSRAGYGGLFPAGALITAFLIMLYPGFVLMKARVIPLWHSWLVPLILMVYSLALGSAVVCILSSLVQTELRPAFPILCLFFSAGVTLCLILVHLIVLKFGNQTRRYTLGQLTRDRFKNFFLGGTLLAGLFLPIGISGYLLTFQIPGAMGAVFAGVLTLIGGWLYEKALFKAAVYIPPEELE